VFPSVPANGSACHCANKDYGIVVGKSAATFTKVALAPTREMIIRRRLLAFFFFLHSTVIIIIDWIADFSQNC
jgi:hypothetical protein